MHMYYRNDEHQDATFVTETYLGMQMFLSLIAEEDIPSVFGKLCYVL